MAKKKLPPFVILAIISLVAALVLGIVNMITEGPIAEHKMAALQEAYNSVLPADHYDPVDYGGNDKGRVAIWWYTDDRRFLAFCKALNEAVSVGNYRQADDTKDRLALWNSLQENLSDKERKQYKNLSYESIESGSVVFDCRTMCFVVHCSERLLEDDRFIKDCLEYFGLTNTRVDCSGV